MKKAFKIFLLFIFFWSCATYQPPPPSLYIESLPASIVAEFSLEERILAEEAWETLNQGEGKKAEKQISKLGAQNPIYNVGLAYAYFLQNRLQRAEEFFKVALKDLPDMTLIHSGLAQIYREKGRDDRAFAEFREILKREPEHPWAKQQYEIFKNKKFDESLLEAKAAIAAGDTEGSKEAYLKALYYAPQSTEAHLVLADIYKKENKLQNALVHLLAASSSEPENTEILKDYAEALYQAVQYTKSLEIYEKLHNLEPENKQIMNRIEGIKNRLGIYELPTRYNSIAFSEAVSKEEIAALLVVKFNGILDKVPGTPPVYHRYCNFLGITIHPSSNFLGYSGYLSQSHFSTEKNCYPGRDGRNSPSFNKLFGKERIQVYPADPTRKNPNLRCCLPQLLL